MRNKWLRLKPRGAIPSRRLQPDLVELTQLWARGIDGLTFMPKPADIEGAFRFIVHYLAQYRQSLNVFMAFLATIRNDGLIPAELVYVGA